MTIVSPFQGLGYFGHRTQGVALGYHLAPRWGFQSEGTKPTPGGRAKKKAEVSLIRSSAAEYLTLAAASGQGGLAAVYTDENVWLTQKMMGLLYNVDVRTISYHLKNVFTDRELDEKSVIQFFRITAADGKTYDTQHYNLAAIIAVGYKVNSERAVQFRKPASTASLPRRTGSSCRMPARSRPKSPKPTPRASLRNTASCRTACSSRTSTG